MGEDTNILAESLFRKYGIFLLRKLFVLGYVSKVLSKLIKPSQINCDSFKLFDAFEKACVLGDAVFVVDFLFDELSKVVVAVKDVLVLVSVAG